MPLPARLPKPLKQHVPVRARRPPAPLREGEGRHGGRVVPCVQRPLQGSWQPLHDILGNGSGCRTIQRSWGELC
eukprot:11456336-Alexandrium_andersonii.AAC.1